MRESGQWVSPREWATDKANEILKKHKLAGQGKGARSGQHGKPFQAAARELRALANDKDLLDEVRAELLRKAKELEARGRTINHK